MLALLRIGGFMSRRDFLLYLSIMVCTIAMIFIPSIAIVVGVFIVGLGVLGATLKMLYSVNPKFWDNVHSVRDNTENTIPELGILPDVKMIQQVLCCKGAIVLYISALLLVATAVVFRHFVL